MPYTEYGQREKSVCCAIKKTKMAEDIPYFVCNDGDISNCAKSLNLFLISLYVARYPI